LLCDRRTNAHAGRTIIEGAWAYRYNARAVRCSNKVKRPEVPRILLNGPNAMKDGA
jgi:hypothetical protein